MTTPSIEEIKAIARDIVQVVVSQWPEYNIMTGRERHNLFDGIKPIIDKALTQAHQAGIDEAVEVMESKLEDWANIEHERWSKWQRYMHSKMVEHSNGKGEFVCLPVELFNRWERQINTPYSELSEAEKESDREQVRPYIDDTIKALQDNK